MYQDEFVARLVILVPNLSLETAEKWTKLAREENCVVHLIQNVANAIDGKVGYITEKRILRLLKTYLVPVNMNTLAALTALTAWYNDNYRWDTAHTGFGSTNEFWFTSKSIADFLSHGTYSRSLGAALSMRLAVLCKPL